MLVIMYYSVWLYILSQFCKSVQHSKCATNLFVTQIYKQTWIFKISCLKIYSWYISDIFVRKYRIYIADIYIGDIYHAIPGFPSIFTQRLKLWTSNLVHSLGLPTPTIKPHPEGSERGLGLGKLPYIWGPPLILLQRLRCPLSISGASCVITDGGFAY